MRRTNRTSVSVSGAALTAILSLSLAGTAQAAPEAAAPSAQASEPRASLGQEEVGKSEKAPGKKGSKNEIVPSDFGELPTFIKSQTLSLRSVDRVFVYSGSVEVKQGDMTLTSDELEGFYDQNNKVEKLIAKQNVVIVKGDNIRATGQKAIYESKSETLTLTENPELQQDESVLTADLIRIFLKEDRSTAEGDVRVKLVGKGKGAANDEETAKATFKLGR